MHRAPVLEWLLAAFLRVAGPARIIVGNCSMATHKRIDIRISRKPRDRRPVGVIPGVACIDR